MTEGALYCFASAPFTWLLCVCASDHHDCAVLVDCDTLAEVRIATEVTHALSEVSGEGEQRDRAIGRVVAHLFASRDFVKHVRGKRAAAEVRRAS